MIRWLRFTCDVFFFSRFQFDLSKSALSVKMSNFIHIFFAAFTYVSSVACFAFYCIITGQSTDVSFNPFLLLFIFFIFLRFFLCLSPFENSLSKQKKRLKKPVCLRMQSNNVAIKQQQRCTQKCHYQSLIMTYTCHTKSSTAIWMWSKSDWIGHWPYPRKSSTPIWMIQTTRILNVAHPICACDQIVLRCKVYVIHSQNKTHFNTK